MRSKFVKFEKFVVENMICVLEILVQMKKLLLLIVVFGLTQASTVKADTNVSAYSNVMYVAAATIDPVVEGSEAQLSICMNNIADIRGFQFDLYLPAGMTAVKNSKGKYAATLSKARLPEDDEHTLSTALQSDGAIRFLCGSQYDETFKGNTGEIATIKVNIAGLVDGKYPVSLRSMNLTETDISKSYKMSNVVTTLTLKSSSGTVSTDTDLSAYRNVMYVAPVTINPAEQGTETDISICMNNTADIRGFQFDLYLPDGMTAVKTSKGRLAASLSKTRLPEDDEHTLTTAVQGDGAIRFLCGSQYDETFTGSTGEIATIKVNIEGMADGKYPIRLKAVKLSETDVNKSYGVDEVVTTLTVSTITGVSRIERATVQPGHLYDMQGRRVTTAKKGLYIRDGKKVVVSK